MGSTGRMLVSDTAVMPKARVRETLPAANFVAPTCRASWLYACGSLPGMKKSLFRLYALSGYLKKGGQLMPTFFAADILASLKLTLSGSLSEV